MRLRATPHALALGHRPVPPAKQSHLLAPLHRLTAVPLRLLARCGVSATSLTAVLLSNKRVNGQVLKTVLPFIKTILKLAA